MLEVRRIEAEEKAKMAEAAERQATKYKESMRLVAEYKENLAEMDIDYTLIAHAGRRELPLDAEATPIPQNRRLHQSYALLDIAPDVAQNGGEDDEEEPPLYRRAK
jgi:hypothetical protein